MNISKILSLASLLLASAMITGCSDDDDDLVVTPVEPPAPVMLTYSVSLINLTTAQPLSPVAVVLHNDERLWQLGMPASQALEVLAEGGDNSDILALGEVSASSEGILMPGANALVELSVEEGNATNLSLATMLVNTNDAFSGLNAVDVSALAVGQAITLRSMVWDAGTEANSEMAGTIPGPADGGTGFDAMRDDVDVVALHQGVVTQDDGLSQSVLTEQHRFDNPALAIVITRTQ